MSLIPGTKENSTHFIYIVFLNATIKNTLKFHYLYTLTILCIFIGLEIIHLYSMWQDVKHTHSRATLPNRYSQQTCVAWATSIQNTSIFAKKKNSTGHGHSASSSWGVTENLRSPPVLTTVLTGPWGRQIITSRIDLQSRSLEAGEIPL